MLRRRPRWTRTRRAAKWSLLALSVLLFAAWFSCLWYTHEVNWWNGSGFHTVSLELGGAVYRSEQNWNGPADQDGATFPAWSARPDGLASAWTVYRWARSGGSSYYLISLLYPAIASVLAVILLSYWDRQRLVMEAPRCACGYDLAGTPGPRCPECGGRTATPSPL